MSNNFVEYFENVLYSQPKVDNYHMSQREIVVLVDRGQNIDFIRNQLWKLCRDLESKLGLEYGFNNDTKIFGIIKRCKDKIYMIRIYVRIIDAMDLQGLRPDIIVAYGSFWAKQIGVMLEFIQKSSYKTDLAVRFFNR